MGWQPDPVRCIFQLFDLSPFGGPAGSERVCVGGGGRLSPEVESNTPPVLLVIHLKTTTGDISFFNFLPS